MKIKSFLTFPIFTLLFLNACAQKEYNRTQSTYNRCIDSVQYKIEKSLFIILGQDWVVNNITKNSKIVISYTLDSLGNILKVNIEKAKLLTAEQINQIEAELKKHKLCLINSDPHLTYDQFIKSGKNQYQYWISYPFILNRK